MGSRAAVDSEDTQPVDKLFSTSDSFYRLFIPTLREYEFYLEREFL